MAASLESMRADYQTLAATVDRQTESMEKGRESTMVAGTERAYREPGIEYPGLPGLPVWDGNPELFEVNADGLGMPSMMSAPASMAASCSSFWSSAEKLFHTRGFTAKISGSFTNNPEVNDGESRKCFRKYNRVLFGGGEYHLDG